MMARRSRSAFARSTITFSIGLTTNEHEFTRIIKGILFCISVDSWLNAVRSARACFGEKLSLRFKPIGLGVTRQCKSAAAFGDEVGAETNCFVRWLRKSSSRLGRH